MPSYTTYPLPYWYLDTLANAIDATVSRALDLSCDSLTDTNTLIAIRRDCDTALDLAGFLTTYNHPHNLTDDVIDRLRERQDFVTEIVGILPD